MEMEMLQHLIFVCLTGIALTLILQVHAQNQSGFISIDCGTARDSRYTDRITGLDYVSDEMFVDTGVSNNVSPDYNSNDIEQQFLNVRSFPEGKRNCYTLKPELGSTKFLVRARFMYGNHDGQGKVPRFDLFLEADLWDSVEFKNASSVITKEIIHIPQRSYIYVCLVNTGFGTPFISVLELRPLQNTTYVTQSGSLVLFDRRDVGSTTNKSIRYKDDVCDRIWLPFSYYLAAPIRKSPNFDQDEYQLPSAVMRTAAIPAYSTNDSLAFYWEPNNPQSKYYVYLHFNDVREVNFNLTREMNIYENGDLWYGPFAPYYFSSRTLFSRIPSSGEKIEFYIKKTENSTLPPILNAFEIYMAINEFPQLLTNQQDVDAIKNIKDIYDVKKNWQGDPCAPKDYLWQGVNCSYDDFEPPKIISLNLSSSEVTGTITSFIFSLSSIQSLDLSNNSLTGPVPEFLAELPSLTVLNLRGNDLKGSVPPGLIEKEKNGSISLRLDGNLNLCRPGSCKGKNKSVIPVVAPVVSVSVLLIALAILWKLKRRKQDGQKGIKLINMRGSLEPKSRSLSYSDVVRITNNFERIIGQGGFGTVYYGNLGDTQVAVKMLSPSSVQGYKQFQAEVDLLIRVHHKNLTSLVGYCDDGTNMGLIYEFMASGNLGTHLLGNSSANILSWERRLGIATEAAQGLEYLHNGCKPPIVHRDVKSTNILLNEKLQAKLSDFGLSRIFPVEGGTHVSTKIAGTPGYLDPEYYISNRLTEKSDVHSFGVVLLEIITGKPVIGTSRGRTHISQWVSSKLANGDIKNIVDPTLLEDYDINSAWKAVEVAMACVCPNSAKRPTMTQVVMELKECLAIETAPTMGDNQTSSKDSSELISFYRHSELSPLAR
ncbi:hypothetical protein ACOSP7_020277 [Xanthoceras sorbifolium]